ncbi:MAG TPA: thioredoxin [Egibacteraceae bacterium]|nr:thioredoxin [Actinomycetota bacterium]HWB70979.1 thioredoxin [Egibacteraceae bacterium]
MSDTATIKDATEATFAADVLEASRSRAVVVDFWAPWCGPCRQLSPLLERVANRYAGEVDVVKVNIDQAPNLARSYRVQSIPAVKAFRDGDVVAEFVGVQPEPVVERLFATLTPSPAERLVARAAAASADDKERLLREAVKVDSAHGPAVVALARLLSERGDVGDALQLLDRVPGDEEARRLRAELRLAAARLDRAELEALRARADAGDGEARLRLGRALASEGRYDEALATLLEAVREPATREEARGAMLEIFQLLDGGHELVRRWRSRLASALF